MTKDHMDPRVFENIMGALMQPGDPSKTIRRECETVLIQLRSRRVEDEKRGALGLALMTVLSELESRQWTEVTKADREQIGRVRAVAYEHARVEAEEAIRACEDDVAVANEDVEKAESARARKAARDEVGKATTKLSRAKKLCAEIMVMCKRLAAEDVRRDANREGADNGRDRG